MSSITMPARVKSTREPGDDGINGEHTREGAIARKRGLMPAYNYLNE